MSIRLRLTNFDRSEQEKIAALLTIQPVESGFQRGRFYQPKESFPFYSCGVDGEGQYLLVPYSFGHRLLREYPHDTREYYPITVTFTAGLRPRQQKKLAQLDHLFDRHLTATLCAHTGFGKTRLANYYIAKFQVLTVVLVPGTQLLDQWPKAIQELLPDAKVGVVGENYGENFFLQDDVWFEHPDVLVCTPNRWAQIPEAVRMKVGFLIVDEGHMFCTRTRCISLLQFEPRYILALTASPRRRDQTIGIIHATCGIEHVRARYKNPVTVWSFSTGLVFPTLKDVRGKTNWTKTTKSMVEDEESNELLADLADYLVNHLGRKPVFMCERKYHVKTLSKKIKDRNITCDDLMETKNTYADSQLLLAIMMKAGTGFDEQYACPDFGGIRIDTVVYCSSFKEINGLIQYGGRAFRAEDPLLIHIVHSNGIVEKHWEEAEKYYLSKEYLTNVTINFLQPSDIWESS